MEEQELREQIARDIEAECQCKAQGLTDPWYTCAYCKAAAIARRKKLYLEHSTKYFAMVHDVEKCEGQPCTAHNRSEHSMRGFMQSWREDIGVMERICEHGIGHPDPDEFKLTTGEYDGVHGCDGCCGL